MSKNKFPNQSPEFMLKNLRFVVHFSLRGFGPQGHLVDLPFKNKRPDEYLKHQIKVCFTGTQSLYQPDLGGGRWCHIHLCTGFMWLTRDVCCHHHTCLHGRERPCQPNLWLSISSRSAHHLQCHHWYREGEGRGSNMLNSCKLQGATTGLEYLHGGHFHSRCFKTPWVIWSV